MSKSSNSGCINAFVYIAFFVIVFGCIFAYKGCAPQSGLRSRYGGKAVKLDRPVDCNQIIMIGKTDDTKYVSYIDTDGNYKLREFSDYGILEAEYIMEAPKTIDIRKKNDE